MPDIDFGRKPWALPDAAVGAGAGLNATNAICVAFVAAGLLIIALKALTLVANYLSLLTLLLATGQGARLAMPGLHVDGLIGVAMLALGAVFVFKCRVLARRVMPLAA